MSQESLKKKQIKWAIAMAILAIVTMAIWFTPLGQRKNKYYIPYSIVTQNNGSVSYPHNFLRGEFSYTPPEVKDFDRYEATVEAIVKGEGDKNLGGVNIRFIAAPIDKPLKTYGKDLILAFTSPLGQFSVKNLPNTDLWAIADSSIQIPTAMGIDVKNSTKEKVLFTMENSCSVEGRVSDMKGNPLSGLTILVIPLIKTPAGWKQSNLSLYSKTDSYGKFSCKDIQICRYKIIAYGKELIFLPSGVVSSEKKFYRSKVIEMDLPVNYESVMPAKESARIISDVISDNVASGEQALTNRGIDIKIFDKSNNLISIEHFQNLGKCELPPLWLGNYKLLAISGSKKSELISVDLSVPHVDVEITLKLQDNNI